MWELNDHKESWMPKNWCFQIVVLEKTFESPLDRKEINPVNPKGNKPWMFIGRTNAEAETPYSGHLMRRTDSFEKTLRLRKIEGRRTRGWQRMRWLDGITDSMGRGWASSWSWWWIGKPGVLQSTGLQRVGHDEWLNSTVHETVTRSENYLNLCFRIYTAKVRPRFSIRSPRFYIEQPLNLFKYVVS